jgi:hypothetical protein
MLSTTPRRIIAVLQAIIGAEWLISGINKLAFGQFPQGLGDAINENLSDNPNGWYVLFLQHVIVPNSVLWGFVIEWSETLVGIALLGGALALLGKPRHRGESQHHLGIALSIASVTAAIICIVLCVNFHFWMGGSVIVPNLNPGRPFDEGIDLDAILPLFSLVVIGSQLQLIALLRERPMFPRLVTFLRSHHPYQTEHTRETLLSGK